MFSALGSRRKTLKEKCIPGSNVLKMFVPCESISACPEAVLVRSLL